MGQIQNAITGAASQVMAAKIGKEIQTDREVNEALKEGESIKQTLADINEPLESTKTEIAGVKKDIKAGEDYKGVTEEDIRQSYTGQALQDALNEYNKYNESLERLEQLKKTKRTQTAQVKRQKDAMKERIARFEKTASKLSIASERYTGGNK